MISLNKLASIALLFNLSFDQVAKYVNADQPVHCLKDDAFGVWDFHVSKDISNVNVFTTNEICTHKRPNHVQIISPDHQFAFQNEDLWRIKLLNGYKAEATQCQSQGKCNSGPISGTWSTIYDQAFRVELDNGMRFIANFRYNIKQNLSTDPIKDGSGKFEGTKTGDYDSFDSKCDESMVGFVQTVGGNGSMKSHKAQCFYAKQIQHYDFEQSQLEENDSGVKIDKIVAKNPAADQAAAPVQKNQGLSQDSQSPPDEQNIFLKTSHKRFNAHRSHVPSDGNDLMIEAINDMELGWKANTCMYQKHHANYGKHCDQEQQQVTLAQTFSDTEEKVFGEGKDFQQALELAQQYMKKYPDADSIPDSELPKNFDWRNVGGYDFTNPHRDQGHCGSCYTVSFTQIMEQRLKLKYGEDMPLLSPQYLMTCNYMNEGCDGGWPFFHGFLAENGHLVTEECAPYKAKTKGDSCSNYASCEPHSKVQKTYFVGKGYGDSTEKNMMKEIMRSGIVNGELQAPQIFSMYTEGVLTQDGIKQLHKNVLNLAQTKAGEVEQESGVSNRNLEDYGISWQNLNHSIVIIGWGEDSESGQKYWIVRNSYGGNWGDHGEILIQRGTDDFGIESETTAYDPVLCSKSQC